MFYNRSTHGSALRSIYGDYELTFDKNLGSNGSFIIHYYNIQTLCIELCKVCENLPKAVSSDLFTRNNMKKQTHATNFTEEDIKNRIEGLINEKKLVTIRQLLNLILSLWHHWQKKYSQRLTQNLFLSHSRHKRCVRFQHKQKIAILTYLISGS